MTNLLNERTYVAEGHLLWGGISTRRGYGLLVVNGRLQLAHRVAWDVAYGPIPEGIQVNHLCDISPCILPWHLYLGTQSDNMRDSVQANTHRNARKTHCKHGHPFTEANTYYSHGGERRDCLAYHRKWNRQSRQARS